MEPIDGSRPYKHDSAKKPDKSSFKKRSQKKTDEAVAPVLRAPLTFKQEVDIRIIRGNGKEEYSEKFDSHHSFTLRDLVETHFPQSTKKEVVAFHARHKELTAKQPNLSAEEEKELKESEKVIKNYDAYFEGVKKDKLKKLALRPAKTFTGPDYITLLHLEGQNKITFNQAEDVELHDKIKDLHEKALLLLKKDISLENLPQELLTDIMLKIRPEDRVFKLNRSDLYDLYIELFLERGKPSTHPKMKYSGQTEKEQLLNKLKQQEILIKRRTNREVNIQNLIEAISKKLDFSTTFSYDPNDKDNETFTFGYASIPDNAVKQYVNSLYKK